MNHRGSDGTMNRIACTLLVALFAPAIPLRGQYTPVQATSVAEPMWVDTLVDVGTHRLHLRVRRGTSRYTILFEAGGGADLTSWASVPSDLADSTAVTIVTYDRAGLGSSELGPLDLSPAQEVADIHQAIRQLALPTPTIVVAHSYGGMLALLHATDLPERVLGLVLVDPMNPRFVHEMGDWLFTTVPDVTNPESDRERVIQRMMRTLDSLSARLLIEEPRLTVPMTIISAGEDWWGNADADDAWRKSHQEIAAVAANRERIIAEHSDHDIPDLQPDVVVAATLRLLFRIDHP